MGSDVDASGQIYPHVPPLHLFPGEGGGGGNEETVGARRVCV